MLPSTARTHRRVLRALAPACATLCAVLLTGGCGGSPAAQGAHGTHGAAHVTPQKETGAQSAPSSSIEEIAAAVGCTAHVDIQADELREGGCETGQGAYRMATFAAEQGQRSWLDEARMYGGTYLVGSRWVVTGPSEEALAALRGHIGGTVEAGAAHTGHE
ncbi:hypothetical protein OG429_32865 [Streptomyces sp. NBC_00190]|uniref:hypothetical protein n=1 Tax=unclassified Streptomyces TaxID=2593676 RepID=UPI002E29EEE8|nr:hypothetical protein [Streptomyces sp. NBC_00190]WSZ43647.1 hypothetical protein OG239_35325 [Streptomyces sp. NBC_00868]